MTQLTKDHQQRFEQIKKDLSVIGYRESSFTKAELLFFEALTISRTYGNDPSENSLLSALKDVQYNQYDQTRVITKTAKQKEQTIKKFIVKFKTVLSGKE